MKYIKKNQHYLHFLFLYFIDISPPFPQQDAHWAVVCAGNPTNEIRGCDKYGCGYFGAPRYYTLNTWGFYYCSVGIDLNSV